MNMTNQSISKTTQYLAWILLIGVGMGISVSVISSFFVIGVGKIADLRTEFLIGGFEMFGNEYSLDAVFWLLVAAILLSLTRFLFNLQRWHGPADSIYAAHRTDNELDMRGGFGSTLASFISLGAGAPVGQYGPLVHFGATLGSFINSIIKDQKITIDTFIGCGVAAAIAAGFNAPIAGIVFAHEAVLRHFSFKAITPIAISSITSAWFSSWIFGGEPLFKLSLVLPDLFPLAPALLMSGLLFGLISIIFMECLFTFNKLGTNSGISFIGLSLIAAVICGVTGVFVPEVLGLGVATINKMLANDYVVLTLFLLVIAKIFASALSIGFGLFGGVFGPALFIGASAGGFAAQSLAIVGITVSPQLFVIAGMAAVSAAVVGAPISVVLIILELTGSYELAVAAMLAVVVSTLLCSLIYGHSFFDMQLTKRGIDVSKGRGNLELMNVSIIDVVNDNYTKFSKDKNASEVIKILVKAASSEGYCIDEKGAFLGKCSIQKLLLSEAEQNIERCFDEAPTVLNHDASIMQAIEVASDFVGESIPVIRANDGLLVGVVSEGDIFQAYLATQNRIHDLEHG